MTTSTHNQEIDKALKDHDKSISDLKSVLEILAKQQEQMLVSLNALAAGNSSHTPHVDRSNSTSTGDQS
ncbi:hypothetical protein L1987_28592 [Smallanthus sonchifolius]|uniref:Uncharacterized protein n=1 Tax=Smallanthus sonchifolius TaxID=185202 RepID=A0ACB9HZ46_9ASTR|nr:hypothetical protein L1987_28592 [Smallanthus sonchifolius]